MSYSISRGVKAGPLRSMRLAISRGEIIELTGDDGQKCWVVEGDGMAHYDPDSALERLEKIKARA
jgi:hypothetical protein